MLQKQKHDGTIKKRVISNTLPSAPLTSLITDNSYVREMEKIQGNSDMPGLQERPDEVFPGVNTPPQLSRDEASMDNNITTYSTLGTPADTTPVEPKPVRIEIVFSPRLCIRTPQYIGKVDPKIKLGQLFFQ